MRSVGSPPRRNIGRVKRAEALAPRNSEDHHLLSRGRTDAALAQMGQTQTNGRVAARNWGSLIYVPVWSAIASVLRQGNWKWPAGAVRFSKLRTAPTTRLDIRASGGSCRCRRRNFYVAYRLLLLVFATKGQAKRLAKELERAGAAGIGLEANPRQIFRSEPRTPGTVSIHGTLALLREVHWDGDDGRWPAPRPVARKRA